MFTFDMARKLFSIVLAAAICLGAAVNLHSRRPAFRTTLAGLEFPFSSSILRRDVELLDRSVKANIAGKHLFLEAHAYLQALMGKRETGGFAVVRSEDGSLDYGTLSHPDYDGLRRYAARVHRLKKAVDAKGGKTLFLNPLDVFVKGGTVFAAGMPFQNLNPLQDAFLNHLREYEVDFLDTRYSLRDSDIPPSEYLFKTDFRWRIETCFEVFADLVDELESLSGAPLDPVRYYRNRDNYHSRTYAGLMLGTLGRVAGANFSGVEDFTVLWPKFEREYSVEMIESNLGFLRREGPTVGSLLHVPALESWRDPYGTLPYHFYMFTVPAWAKIVNRRNDAAPRLLLIHDSHAMPLVCFLAPLFSEIHTICPSAGPPAVNIEKYVEDNAFDFVVVELSPDKYNDRDMDFFVAPGRLP